MYCRETHNRLKDNEEVLHLAETKLIYSRDDDLYHQKTLANSEINSNFKNAQYSVPVMTLSPKEGPIMVLLKIPAHTLIFCRYYVCASTIQSNVPSKRKVASTENRIWSKKLGLVLNIFNIVTQNSTLSSGSSSFSSCTNFAL
uniref:Uncharacterized protein LOC114339792 n=1 Tax=Diabrotica virgifera virgifera TaxID=50390 RepID=A0A6P7GAU2_DIAVI